MPLNTDLIRQQFPSLNRPAVFLDNPAGTQISKQSLDRINRYLLEHNANHEGMFETSRRSDEVLHEAHGSMADFLNASRPEEIIFGNNMTTLTLHISLDIDVEEGTLDLDDFAKALERKPKIAAFGYASNLLGTVNPVKKLTKMAHEAGALVYIDAVQYAPHGPIDVQDLDCDFLVCSSYKYSETQITRHVQFHSSPGHWKDKTVTFWNQIPKRVMGYNECLSPFSFRSAVLDEAHQAMADFYNASSAQEIVFGNNMTTLTLYISRSISREWKEGDEIVVTRLDHDANVTPWVLAAQDRGVKVNWVDFDVEDGTLKLDDLQKALERKPRLLAVGYASNSLGTINPVEKITKMAHAAGTMVYIDAVQYAPHGPTTRYALQPISSLENSKPVHKIMRALQVCSEQLNTLNGWEKNLVMNMQKV